MTVNNIIATVGKAQDINVTLSNAQPVMATLNTIDVSQSITVTDTNSVDLTFAGGNLSAVIIPGGISHTNISDIGTNTHPQIDSHIEDATIHFSDLSTFNTDNLGEGTTNLYDKTVSLTSGVGILVTGTYPDFTITNTGEANSFIGGNGIDITEDPVDTYTFVVNQGEINHTNISDIGTNTHPQIDSHIIDTTSHTSDATIHFTEGSISHTSISDIGTNTHPQIDSHIVDTISHTSDVTIHFTEGSISHTNISDIGTNTHPQIDSHIANVTSNPHVVTKTQIGLSNVDDIQQMPLSYLDTSVALGTSDIKVSSQNAVKTYVDTIVNAAIRLQGDWNANTNIPDVSGTTTTGFAWRVSVDGATNLGGITDWRVGDLAVKTDLSWLKIDNEDISAIWGNITGTISNQTDLQDELNLKSTVGELTSHTSDATIHFTEGSISHTNISDIGTNTHPQIDSHIVDTISHTSDATIHFSDLSTFNTDNLGEGTTNLYDKTVSLTSGIGILISGTYPDFTITNTGEANSFIGGTDITVTENPDDTFTFDFANDTGYVTGPASSTDDNLATFDLTTGKIIQDSGINISAVTDATAHISSSGTSHSYINQDVTTSGEPSFATVDIVNAGTGEGLKIDQNGNGIGLNIDSEASTTTNYGLKVDVSQGARAGLFYQSANEQCVRVEKAGIGTGNAFRVLNEGTGEGVFIDQNGNGIGLSIDSEATTANAVTITYPGSGNGINIITSAASTGNSMKLQDTGTGGALLIDQDGQAIGLNIDSEATENPAFQVTAAVVTTGPLLEIRNVANMTANDGSARNGVIFLEQAGSGSTKPVGHFKNEGTGEGAFIDQNGDGVGLKIDSEATTNPAILINIVDGDAHLRLEGDSGNATPTEGDLWRESTGLMYYDGTTEHDLLNDTSKAPIADPTFTGEIGIGAVNVSETELGILDGATLDTTELNYVDGVTSSIQTQIDSKADLDVGILSKSSTYEVASGDAGKVIECDGTFTVTLPDSLDTGFTIIIVNVGSGTITLAAATTLHTKGAAVTLPNQYGAATAYHSGSDIWTAFGDLE